MNINIEDVLPHRDPFLYVDEILEYSYMKFAIGKKKVKSDEYWVKGHFPEHPVYPGVLLLETMAQVGGFVFAGDANNNVNKAFLSKVDNLKFKRKVVLGDSIYVEAKYVDSFLKYFRVYVKAFVADKAVASCEITYTFKDML